MDVGIVRALGSPEGKELLRSLPTYDEYQVMPSGTGCAGRVTPPSSSPRS